MVNHFRSWNTYFGEGISEDDFRTFVMPKLKAIKKGLRSHGFPKESTDKDVVRTIYDVITHFSVPMENLVGTKNHDKWLADEDVDGLWNRYRTILSTYSGRKEWREEVDPDGVDQRGFSASASPLTPISTGSFPTPTTAAGVATAMGATSSSESRSPVDEVRALRSRLGEKSLPPPGEANNFQGFMKSGHPLARFFKDTPGTDLSKKYFYYDIRPKINLMLTAAKLNKNFDMMDIHGKTVKPFPSHTKSQSFPRFTKYLVHFDRDGTLSDDLLKNIKIAPHAWNNREDVLDVLQGYINAAESPALEAKLKESKTGYATDDESFQKFYTKVLIVRNLIPEGMRGVVMPKGEEDWGGIMGVLKPEAFTSDAFQDNTIDRPQFVEEVLKFKVDSDHVQLAAGATESRGGAGSMPHDTFSFDDPNIEDMAEAAAAAAPPEEPRPQQRAPDRGGSDPNSGALGGDERATHTQAHVDPARGAGGSALAADRDPDPTDGYHLSTTAQWSTLGSFMERHGRSYDKTFNRHIRFDPIAASHDTTSRLARVNYTNAIKWDNFNRYDKVKSNKLFPLI